MALPINGTPAVHTAPVVPEVLKAEYRSHQVPALEAARGLNLDETKRLLTSDPLAREILDGDTLNVGSVKIGNSDFTVFFASRRGDSTVDTFFLVGPLNVVSEEQRLFLPKDDQTGVGFPFTPAPSGRCGRDRGVYGLFNRMTDSVVPAIVDAFEGNPPVDPQNCR